MKKLSWILCIGLIGLFNGCTSLSTPAFIPSPSMKFNAGSTVTPLSGETPPQFGSPTAAAGTQRSSSSKIIEVEPGIYTTNDLSLLPLPLSGYNLFVVGETHGSREAKQFLLVYLQHLHQVIGLQDLLLEEDPAFEKGVNAYVLGLTDAYPQQLCLRADVLTLVREYNATLKPNEKIKIHLVDVDSPIDTIYAHLKDLDSQLSTNKAKGTFPTLNEVKTWDQTQAFDYVDHEMSLASGNSEVLNGLETVRSSFQFYYMGDRIGTGPSTLSVAGALIRENAIAQNVEYVLQKLNGAPALALYGADHVHKVMPVSPKMKSWVEQVTESGISVYSIPVFGETGSISWRGTTIDLRTLGGGDLFQLADRTTIADLFKSHPDQDFLYIDLSQDQSNSIRMVYQIETGPVNIPARGAYDGLMFFRIFTPMVDACH